MLYISRSKCVMLCKWKLGSLTSQLVLILLMVRCTYMVISVNIFFTLGDFQVSRKWVATVASILACLKWGADTHLLLPLSLSVFLSPFLNLKSHWEMCFCILKKRNWSASVLKMSYPWWDGWAQMQLLTHYTVYVWYLSKLKLWEKSTVSHWWMVGSERRSSSARPVWLEPLQKFSLGHWFPEKRGILPLVLWPTTLAPSKATGSGGMGLRWVNLLPWT